jgi:hypothetical protein
MNILRWLFVSVLSVGIAEARVSLCIDSQSFIRVNQKQLNQYVSKWSGLWDTVLNPSLNPLEAAEQRFWKKLEDEWGLQNGSEIMLVRDQDGKRVLPWVMIRWFKGEITGKEAVDLIRARSAAFITEIAAVAFSAELLARHAEIVPGSVQFLEKCAQRASLFMVGNWHLEVFDQVAPNVQAALRFIPAEHRYISGCMKLLLPCDIDMMCELIARNSQQDVANIIFVTASPYHAQAAQLKGIKTVLIVNDNFDVAYRMLESYLN